MSDRRSFVGWLGSLPLVGRPRPLGAVPPIVIDATPTALYQQPDGRNNLVRVAVRSEEHTSELQSQSNLVCRLLLEKKKQHEVQIRTPITISQLSPMLMI